MCWVRVTGGRPSPNDKPEESKGCFLKCYLCLAQRRREGRKGIYKRRSVWWGEIHGAEKGGATGTCDPGRTGHLGANTLGCFVFFCSERVAAPDQDSETFLSKSYHWRGQLLMLLSPEIQRLGGIITDKLVMKIWILLEIMKNFTLVSSNKGGKKNITNCFVVEGTVALYDQRMSFFSQPKSAVSICFLTFCTFCCTALLFLASFTVV